MSEKMDKSRIGEIPLYDNHAIGLSLISGNIGLHRISGLGFMIGISAYVFARSFREAGAMGGFMTMSEGTLEIPSAKGNYTGLISGWDFHDSDGYYDFYKPAKSKLLPHHDEYTNFAYLDAHGEIDPYFYFGWGRRNDHMPPFGYRNRQTILRMGVNFPIYDSVKPSWANVPDQNTLMTLLKTEAPSGIWKLKSHFSGFTVDSGVTQKTGLDFIVVQGQRRYYRGAAAFIKPGLYAIGVANVDFTGIYWGTVNEPGQIKILSGKGAGKFLTVTGSFFTGPNPPQGLPANMWFIEAQLGSQSPYQLGMSTGDNFIAMSPYDFAAHILIDEHYEFSPGGYPPADYEFEFSPIM